MKKRNEGFTIIEMVVVVSIIAILAAIAIPSFLKAVSTSKAAACASNRHSAEMTLQAEMMLDQLELSDLDKAFDNLLMTCPDHGTLYVKYNQELKKVSVECTKHTRTLTQNVLDKFIDMCKNFDDFSSYENNKNVRDAMYELLGGTWNTIGFHGDDNPYYIQPYWDVTTNEMYVYAGSTNEASGSWYNGYIYNAQEATWYHGKSFSFVSSDISGWDDVWGKMQENGWKPVDVAYEK